MTSLRLCHYIFSYTTLFRSRLLGGQSSLKKFYNFDTNPVYTLQSVKDGTNQVANFADYKPESLNSFELGYKGLLFDNKMLIDIRSEEHTSELQSRENLVCRL